MNEPSYRHMLRWDRLKRKGQKCRILKSSGHLCDVEFEDGFTAVLERRALTRLHDDPFSDLWKQRSAARSPEVNLSTEE